MALLKILTFFIFACVGQEYNRGLYPHWKDLDGDCMNARHEILLERAADLDSVKVDERGCKVVAGAWGDFYSGKLLTDVSTVDIDHVVSLKEAHEGGAHAWSREKRREFANDPENLVITSRKNNRTKAANGPAKWLPSNRYGKCRYIEKRMEIHIKYNIGISGEDFEALINKFTGC